MIYKAKKSLGQNFLKSQKALNKMCEASEVCEKDIVLEIGPGKGALTSKLLEKAKVVFAVEKDRDLIELLEEKFEKEIKSKKLILLNEDILNFEIPKEIKKYKIIANIPYNITGAILKKFLSSDKQPEKMALLVQKEVAERIVAKDDKESILSISVKAYGIPKYTMTVNKKFFSPSPKVDSAIILIDKISKSNFKNEKEENYFFLILKAGFAHKRKVAIRNIGNILKDNSVIQKEFENLSLNTKARAENININKWLLLNRKIMENPGNFKP